MQNSKLRRQIAWEAARLLYSRQESEYYRAKMKAARQIQKGWVKPADLPSNVEIRDQVQLMARMFEGQRRDERLLEMRLHALRLLTVLDRFRPRLIGSVLTGHIRDGSDIDIHVFSDSVEAVLMLLQDEGFVCEVEHKQVRKQGEARIFHHIHIRDVFPIELTIYPAQKVRYVFKSSITGRAIERASLAELEQLLAREYPELDIDEAADEAANQVDRFQVFEALLLPLENVKQSPKYHPEGDALYHTLQVFQLAREELPYDEEFLLAALLHDVGKAIDPTDHVQAGLEALEGFITPRTEWLIAHHMEAHGIRDGSIGARAHRRLRADESYEELVLLSECDYGGRQVGVMVPDVDEVLEYLRELSQMCG
ncbi:MAG: HD domain-containing protein [Planctomycetales bacterium]|nr:HD domain-containing protein [Planctomycetales bacterium]